jgi:serine-type D-Ala-D-Ala carboxypeptidase (penicillin-binding protein 5/6)
MNGTFLRRTSYPTSGYSLGTRNKRSSRRLLAPPRRRNPLAVPLLAAVVIAGILGLHVLTTPATRAMRIVAATSKPPATVRPRASSPQPVAVVPRAAPSPTPSPSPTPAPTSLPEVKVPTISRTWLKTHPPAVTPAIKGRAAIVVDLTAGQVLYEQAGTTRYAEASITKLMTAMVAVDLAPLDTTITVSAQATQVEPNVMGLSAGERLTLRELLEGLLLNSGNDAAEAIASGIVDRSHFVDFMNQKAAALHLRGTHFTNPSGLDDPNHFSTASDLAVVSATLLADYPDLRTIVGLKDVTIPATAQHKAFTPSNIDRLLWTYPGAIGLKPGYTDAAGYCLAAAATRHGRTILAIVLGSTQHFTDAATLLDYGFAHPVTR